MSKQRSFVFTFIVSRRPSETFDVNIIASDEEMAVAKLDKIILGEKRHNLREVSEIGGFHEEN